MGKAIQKVGDFLSDLGTFGASVLFGGLAGLGVAMMPDGVDQEPTRWKPALDEGLPFPMGDRVPVAGFVQYRATYGPTNRYQTIVSTLAASGPIQEFLKTTIDDEETHFGTNDVATDGAHAGDLWLQTRLGNQPETAHTSPTGLDESATAPDWTTDHKMSGRASDMITMKENSKQDGYRGGVPKRLHIVKALRGWDPTLDSTWPGGSGPCRLLQPSTWVGINDGPTWALNWAIGRWEGSSGGGLYGVPYACSLVGGIGASLDAIDVTAFINAGIVARANGWTLCAVPTSKHDKFAVLNELLRAGGAEPSRVGGKISCVTRGEVQPSLLTVTMADLAGAPELSLAQSRLERKNLAISSFTSEEHFWEMVEVEEVGNPDWLTEDRGRKRYARPKFEFVSDADQAAQLGYYEVADAREPRSGTLPLKPHLRQLRPGDAFSLSLPGTSLDGAKVKVRRRRTNPMTGGVQIEFREETDAKHAAALAVTGGTPPIVAPEPPPEPEASPPDFFETTLIGSSVKIDWRNPTDDQFLRSRVFRGTTTDFSVATQILNRVGERGALETYTDAAPGSGVKYYWVQAEGLDPSYVSDPVGPESETVP